MNNQSKQAICNSFAGKRDAFMQAGVRDTLAGVDDFVVAKASKLQIPQSVSTSKTQLERIKPGFPFYHRG